MNKLIDRFFNGVLFAGLSLWWFTAVLFGAWVLWHLTGHS